MTYTSHITYHIVLTSHMTYHMILEWLKQHLQEGLGGEQRPLVQLFLPEVKVVMHGLHQGTEKVHTGMADAIVLPLQGSHDLTPHNFSKTVGIKKQVITSFPGKLT